MKLTKTEALILEQLMAAAGSELYGLQMVKASAGQLKMGSVYVLLSRLQDKGFVDSRKEEQALQVVPRRLYKITGAGERYFRAMQAAEAALRHDLQGAVA